MAGAFENRKTLVRIVGGIFVALLGVSMLLYLVPQGPTSGEAAPDTVAQIGDQTVTVTDVRSQLNQFEQHGNVPRQLEALYAQQILKNLVFQRELEYEAKRLGIRVTDEERAERIRQLLPTAFNGDAFVGMERYSADVESRFGMSVPQFEDLVRQGLLEDKFRRLVTDGVGATKDDLQEEFLGRNEKIKLAYVYVKPEELESKISPTDAEIKAGYEKNKTKYQVPEKRVVRYGLLDIHQLRQSVQVSDSDLKALYQQNIQQYEVPNRVHVKHILFKTVGKTDAEVEEIRKKAEDVLKQAKKGAKFEDLAKKYSEDVTKDKGGDLGWIVQRQTVPEFEKAAFSLPVGSVSDLIRTQYGFHIIKVLERETAHTKPFEEVKESLRAPLVLQKADQQASDTADKMASEIRRSNRISLDELAKQFHLTISETRPTPAADPLLELGNSQEIKDAIFRLRLGELSQPLSTDRGYVVLSLKEIQPAHQGTLDEVKDRITADLKQEKADELARSKAGELVRRVKAGEKLESAAKALGLEAKTSDLFARNGSISGVASGRQLAAAFAMQPGQTPAPLPIGKNWLVYQVAEKVEPNPADFDKQQKDLRESVLQNKRSLAFDAFRSSLENRLKQEGILKMMPERLKGFGNLG